MKQAVDILSDLRVREMSLQNILERGTFYVVGKSWRREMMNLANTLPELGI